MTIVDQKRMLGVQEVDGWTTVYINSSSLDVIATCKRKAYYLIERGIRSKTISKPQLFGTAIHKALEVWYTTKDETKAIHAFTQIAEPLGVEHEKDKRHPNNGIKILRNYFETYKDDPYEILSDSKGLMVERDFEFEVYRNDKERLSIWLFGRIDCVMKNKDTNEVYVVDHKTTSSLGVEFFQRINPNFQYTTYLLAAQKCLNLDTDRFLVNGIQVAKTKWDLARQFTNRDEGDFKELIDAYVQATKDYLACRKTENWPMTAPSPCTMWGGCQYREICSVPRDLREEMIGNMYADPNRLEETENA